MNLDGPAPRTPGSGGRPPAVVLPAIGLYRARSRLYRNEILQANMRLKALAEIYAIAARSSGAASHIRPADRPDVGERKAVTRWKADGGETSAGPLRSG